MRAPGIVVPAPALDDDLGFLEAVEDLAVEQFVAQLGVEALAAAVFPGAAGQRVAIPHGVHLRPVEALQAWTAAAGITRGPLFRSVTIKGRLGEGSITGHTVALVVNRYAAKAGLQVDDFSGHSLRAGFVTSAAESRRRHQPDHGRFEARGPADSVDLHQTGGSVQGSRRGKLSLVPALQVTELAWSRELPGRSRP